MSLPTLFEYLPYEQAAALTKLAEDPHSTPAPTAPKAKKLPSIPGMIARNALGMGAGMGAGFGASMLAKKIYEKVEGKPIPHGFLLPAASMVGGGLGLAYSLYRTHEQEEIRDVLKAKRDLAKGRVSGK